MNGPCSLCGNVPFIHSVNLLQERSWEPASNKLATTLPLTKLMISASFQGSRNLTGETLLFGTQARS